MKKIILFAISSVVLSLVISCSQDEITETPSSVESKSSFPLESQRNVNGSDNLNMEDAYTLEEIDNLIQQELKEEYKNYTKIENLNEYLGNKVSAKDINSEESSKTAPIYYTVPSVKSRIRQNDRIIISNGDGGLATGVYFCDIYEHKAEVSLPPNTFGVANVPNPVGYNNISQQVLGITQYVNSGPTGNKLVILTYTIHVRSNILGQNINVTIPNNLPPGFLYTYRILS